MALVKLLKELKRRLMKQIWVRKVTVERWNHLLTPKVCYRIRKLKKKLDM